MLYVLLVVRILHAILGTAAATIKGSLQQSRLLLYRWSVFHFDVATSEEALASTGS